MPHGTESGPTVLGGEDAVGRMGFHPPVLLGVAIDGLVLPVRTCGLRGRGPGRFRAKRRPVAAHAHTGRAGWNGGDQRPKITVAHSGQGA